MIFPSSFIFGLCFFSAIVSGFPPSLTHRAIEPEKPSEDPFYTPPLGYEDAAPGTILRHRTVPFPIAALGAIPVNLAQAYHILYRSTDSFDQPTATVLTILIPHDADTSKVLSYQVAEDAAYLNCAPSYALQLNSDRGGPLGTIINQAELLLMIGALEQGWVLILPDFEGPNAAFLAHIRAGYAVLDGIRAALSSANFTDIPPEAQVTMWGYSGGSLATAFASELQPSYAPDVHIAGAALGGIISDIYNSLGALNKALLAGLVAAGILGLGNEYPEIESLIQKYVLESKREKLMEARHQCVGANFLKYMYQDVLSYFGDNANELLAGDYAQKVLNDISPGNQSPHIPLFVYKSVGDEVGPVEDTDKMVTGYCASGTSVDYRRDLLSNHGLLAVTGAPDAILWLGARLDGIPAMKGCSTSTELTGLLDPSTLSVLSKNVVNGLLDLAGKPIGFGLLV